MLLDCDDSFLDRLPSSEVSPVLESEADPDREESGLHNGVHDGQGLPVHGDGLYRNEAHTSILNGESCSLISSHFSNSGHLQSFYPVPVPVHKLLMCYPGLTKCFSLSLCS